MRQVEIFLKKAPVVSGFILLCVIELLLSYLTGGVSHRVLFTTYHSSLSDPLTYIRFFTHVLGHSGLEHLAKNMLFLVLLGTMLEEDYGSFRILVLILLTALITSVINYVFFPRVVLCGASGVGYAFLLMAIVINIRRRSVSRIQILLIVLILGEQFVNGVRAHDNISHMAHLVGGIMGGLAGICVRQRHGKAI